MSDLIDLVEIWLKKPNVENCVGELEAKLLKDEVDLLSDEAYIRLWNEWRDQVETKINGRVVEAIRYFSKQKEAKYKLVSLFLQDLFDWFEKSQKHENEELEIKVLDRQYSKSTLNAKNLTRPHQSRFFFGMCPVSLTTATSSTDQLKACSGCHSILYSGREQQKLHWKTHKDVCKILKGNGSKQHPLSFHPELSGKLQMALETKLRRQLTQFESDMLVYPRLCMVCLNGDQSCLVDCQDCHCVAYCSIEHKEEDQIEHKKSCRFLSQVMENYRHQVEWEGYISDSMIPRISETANRSQILPSNIDSVFMHDLNVFYNMQSVKETSTSRDILPELRQLTFRYTCQLTVLFALEKAYSSEVLWSMETLSLHLVGARSAEADEFRKWEILPSLLPNMKRMEILFIGPELEWSGSHVSDHFQYISSYLKSKRPGLEITYRFVQSTYHDEFPVKNIIKKSKSKKLPHSKPDLLAALNCGFIFYKSWQPSIASMVNHGVPLAFTEYYHEDCQLDLNLVIDLMEEEDEYEEIMETICEPIENPFCSSLPARIPTGFQFRKFKRKNVVMSNDFIAIVKRIYFKGK